MEKTNGDFNSCIQCGYPLIKISKMAECNRCGYSSSRKSHNDFIAKRKGFKSYKNYKDFIQSLINNLWN